VAELSGGAAGDAGVVAEVEWRGARKAVEGVDLARQAVVAAGRAEIAEVCGVDGRNSAGWTDRQAGGESRVADEQQGGQQADRAE
jgi:hypothetical protein